MRLGSGLTAHMIQSQSRNGQWVFNLPDGQQLTEVGC